MGNDIDMICKKKKETGSAAELPSICKKLPVAGLAGKNTIWVFAFYSYDNVLSDMCQSENYLINIFL